MINGGLNVEDKTFLVYEDETGQAEVRDEMVATIAALAATGVEGVASLDNGITGEIVSKLGKKRLASGVEIIENGDVVDVYIALVVEMGVVIPEVTRNVQTKVKSEIEDMLGIMVGNVNIRVASVKVG